MSTLATVAIRYILARSRMLMHILAQERMGPLALPNYTSTNTPTGSRRPAREALNPQGLILY